MQGAFHWLRIQVFCYATENEDLIHDTMVELLDNDEFDVEVCDSEHGNRMIILQQELKKQKEFVALFSKFPKKLIDAVIDDIENRIDDDCVFYLRLNKQKAVQGEYAIAHHGDVISVTGKVVSHPARKEIAVANLTEFLKGIAPVQCAQSEPSE
jgi:hypothetical protein